MKFIISCGKITCVEAPNSVLLCGSLNSASFLCHHLETYSLKDAAVFDVKDRHCPEVQKADNFYWNLLNGKEIFSRRLQIPF